jgi:hypothetical protein
MRERFMKGAASKFEVVRPEAGRSAGVPNLELSSARWKIRWSWGVFAGVVMALLSLYPQIDLWITRGTDWQGSYASVCYDEEVYAAYVNGLVLGRPRRVEPLEIQRSGRPPHESLFSIQFIPAYLIALLTRALRLSVSESFVVLAPLMAYLSALVLFYLLASITRDEALSAVCAVAVLVFGTLAARHSVAMDWIGRSWYGSFLFLRRYVHAFSFPIFLGFVAINWQAFIRQRRQAWVAAIGAGLLFAVLVFSYFFMWTAALAWLACFVLIWLLARRHEWLLVIKRLTPTMLVAIPALTVYAVLFSHRNPATDPRWLMLNFTHAPDFNRAPEWIAAVALLLMIWAVKTKRVQLREPVLLFVASLVLMPFAVFNQQMITGRSLEPVHYEMFNANYVSLLSLALVLIVFWKGRNFHSQRPAPRWLVAMLSCFVIGWGVIEMRGITFQTRERNIKRDRLLPLTRRLTELAAGHNANGKDREVVFSPDILVVSDNIALAAPQTPFWGTHVPLFAGLSSEEQQERYFQYLYYSGMPPILFRQQLSDNEMITIGSTFGYQRYNPTLIAEFHPITATEIDDRVREYAEYIDSFGQERAQQTKISYVVLDAHSVFDFTNLDRWYVRDAGEKMGPFLLYQVKLR